MCTAGLDADAKVVTLASGRTIRYNKLLSTMSLDYTLKLVGQESLGEGLVYSSTHVVGVGIRGEMPHGTKCWLYFPEDDCPFYRVTVFSNYAKTNCPGTTGRVVRVCACAAICVPRVGGTGISAVRCSL